MSRGHIRSRLPTLASSGAVGALVVWLIKLAGFTLMAVALLLLPSGRLTWAMGWAYIGVALVCQAVAGIVIVSRNPEVITERARGGKEAKAWDKVLVGLINICFPPTTWIIAGLDQRLGWSAKLGLGVQLTALAPFLAGYSLLYWAMASNKFFSDVVRIQMDRGHTVATGGPYRYVRHPGYLGMIILALATPPALGSLWALIPAVPTAVLLIVRTALEDRTLQEELAGYKEYTQQVRYRLLPGIW